MRESDSVRKQQDPDASTEIGAPCTRPNKAEGNLRNGEAAYKLAAIVESSDDAIIGKTLDGTITSWNAAAEKLYGYTSEEAIGQSISFIAPPENPQEIPDILSLIANGEKVDHYETERVTKDGRRITVSLTISPIKGASGEIIGASTIARDVTGRKQAEDILRRYQLLSENSRDIILIVRRDGRIIEANKAAVDAYGYTREELLGMSVHDLRAEYTVYDIDLQMEKADVTGVLFETVHKRRDGSTFPVEISSQGTTIGSERVLLSIVRDISERKKAEEEVERARKALEEVYQREHKIAETLQRNFLPEAIPQVAGFEIAEAYHPALDEAAVGGDMYDSFRLADGKVGIVIADVSGKGLQAARYGAMVKYMLRAYAYRTEAPSQVLSVLNDSITGDLEENIFITCFYGVLDPLSHTFAYANAGHNEPLLISPKLPYPSRLGITGRALGVLAGASYTARNITIESGDCVLLYTDGVTDARGVEKRMDTDGLEKFLIGIDSPSPRDLISTVMDEVRRRSGHKLADDVAMIAIRAV